MSVIFPSPRPLNAASWRGLRVGLLGGSFNPPHPGHVHISKIALRMLRLDCVWWLISPQNPFKSAAGTAQFDARWQACRAITAGEPRLVISDLEPFYGTVRTADTLSKLLPDFRLTQFAWITGQDIVFDFHRWQRWRDILDMVATAHIARPPATWTVRRSPLKLLASQNHRHLTKPVKAPLDAGRTYWLPATRLDTASSTALRAAGATKKIFAPDAGTA